MEEELQEVMILKKVENGETSEIRAISNQLRLVVYRIIYKVFIHPKGGCLEI